MFVVSFGLDRQCKSYQKNIYLFLLKTPSAGRISPLNFRDFQGFDIGPLKSIPLGHSFNIPRYRDSQFYTGRFHLPL